MDVVCFDYLMTFVERYKLRRYMCRYRTYVLTLVTKKQNFLKDFVNVLVFEILFKASILYLYFNYITKKYFILYCKFRPSVCTFTRMYKEEC